MTVPEAYQPRQSSEDMFRRAALFASGLLALRDSPRLMEWVRELAETLAVPIAGVGIIERGHCWLPVTVGMTVDRVPIENCLSAHIVATGRGAAIADLYDDPQFADSQMVRPPLSMRACAGAPLLGANGTPVGTVIIADARIRPDFTPRILPRLEKMAQRIMAEAAAPHHLRRMGRTTVEGLEALIRIAARDGDDELVRAIDRVMRDVLPHTGMRGA